MSVIYLTEPLTVKADSIDPIKHCFYYGDALVMASYGLKGVSECNALGIIEGAGISMHEALPRIRCDRRSDDVYAMFVARHEWLNRDRVFFRAETDFSGAVCTDVYYGVDDHGCCCYCDLIIVRVRASDLPALFLVRELEGTYAAHVLHRAGVETLRGKKDVDDIIASVCSLSCLSKEEAESLTSYLFPPSLAEFGRSKASTWAPVVNW